MSYIGSTEWFQEVQAGNVTGWSAVHKFGWASVGTSFAPICSSDVYQTPTSATSLELVSDDATDDAGNVGATKVTVQGLNSSWAQVSQEITMDGTTPVALGTDLIRAYRMWVSESGTYATAAAAGGSHAGTLTLRVAGAGATWAVIDDQASVGIDAGQSLIGCYTVPTGYNAYLHSISLANDSAKTIDFVMMKRLNADDVSTPFTGTLRTIYYEVGIADRWEIMPRSPISIGAGPCDVICMAKTGTGSADVSVDFELLLESTA